MAKNQGDVSVYKQLSADMRDGLKNIYLQASSAGATSAEAMFTEAADQLDEVVRTTESAAMSIMEIVEKQETLAQEGEKIIAALQKDFPSKEMDRLAEINRELRQDLLSVLTALSFQDITGQRIKKVLGALRSIEKTVLDLYLSSGLILEGAEKSPEKDAATLTEEARQAVADYRETQITGSRLKGPDANGVSQAAIDDMLSQLGL